MNDADLWSALVSRMTEERSGPAGANVPAVTDVAPTTA
jgi:hypothetical protein